MRLALLLGLIATFAAADPLREEQISRRRSANVFLIAPATRPRQQPAVDEDGRAALERAAVRKTGHERLAALDALTTALDELSPTDAELELLMMEISEWYVVVMKEPSLDTYRYADELMVRAAKSVRAPEFEKLAIATLERMLKKFPKSPFAYDAHLYLAQRAEGDHEMKEAIAHYEAIVATEQRPQFATFARVRLGWAHHLAKDDKRAVRELAAVMTGDDPLLADAAADLIGEAIPKGGSLEQAIALFDRVDGSRAAERLRRLGDEYERARDLTAEVRARRAAIAREGDRSTICNDRVEIVLASVEAPNKADAELAIAEMREAMQHGDAQCAVDAENAMWALGMAWRKLKVGRERLLRAWDLVIEVSRDERRAAAQKIRAELAGPKSTTR